MGDSDQSTHQKSQSPQVSQVERQTKSKAKQDAKNDPGFAAAGQPQWAPPESQPEPTPTEPILIHDQSFQPNH